jgi:hypothetical protein
LSTKALLSERLNAAAAKEKLFSNFTVDSVDAMLRTSGGHSILIGKDARGQDSVLAMTTKSYDFKMDDQEKIQSHAKSRIDSKSAIHDLVSELVFVKTGDWTVSSTAAKSDQFNVLHFQNNILGIDEFVGFAANREQIGGSTGNFEYTDRQGWNGSYAILPEKNVKGVGFDKLETVAKEYAKRQGDSDGPHNGSLGIDEV